MAEKEDEKVHPPLDKDESAENEERKRRVTSNSLERTNSTMAENEDEKVLPPLDKDESAENEKRKSRVTSSTLERENSTMAENEGQQDMSESSENRNPAERARYKSPIFREPNFPTFVFSVTPAILIKFAIDCLCDPEFNETASCRFDVNKPGSLIRVQNSSTKAIGILGFIGPKFRCFTPLFGLEILDLPLLSHRLSSFEDAESVIVFQRSGTDRISFQREYGKIDTGDFTLFHMDLHVSNEQGPKSISRFSKANVPSNDIRVLVHHLVRSIPSQVSVDIKENIATLKVGSGNSWEAKYKMSQVIGKEGSWEVNPNTNYHVCFKWGKLNLLKKAIEIKENVELVVCLTEGFIVLRFFIRDKWILEFRKVYETCSTNRKKMNLKEEIRTEFDALMAAGTFTSSEAAVHAIQRVKERYC